MQKHGKFITFEGIEGTGKTTQIQKINDHFLKKGMTVFLTREPGGTKLGNELRSLLLEKRSEKVEPLTELFLMEAARAQHVSLVLKKALRENDLILCDRFIDATVAYQSGGRGLDQSLVLKVNEHASFGIRPDLTILLDMPVKTALKRALLRSEKTLGCKEDRFEHETLQFHERVRKTYLELAQSNPKRFLIVDASQPQEQIFLKIIAHVESKVEFI